MSLRPFTVGLAAAALLLAACGEEKVATYRVPKEKDPALPMAAAPDSGATPPASGGASMADTSVPMASGAALAWQAPSAWTQKPASAMRKATYAVPGGGGESELSITAFSGDTGGEFANVNRWRGQVGLAPLRAEDLDGAVHRLQGNGLTFTVVELVAQGDPSGKSILGAIVPFEGSTWFFKLTGPASAVEGAKPAFIEFLHTVKAPDPR
jgi:hypothetical protein